MRITGYNKIVIEGDLNGQNFDFFISNDKAGEEDPIYFYKKFVKTGKRDNNKKNSIIDISNMEGYYYIGFIFGNSGLTQVDRIYLEK